MEKCIISTKIADRFVQQQFHKNEYLLTAARLASQLSQSLLCKMIKKRKFSGKCA